MAKKNVWYQCGRKNRYRDEHAANYFRRIFEEERGTKLDYYWCPYCNGYHLTSEKFRPEGYGLMQDEKGEWVSTANTQTGTPVIRKYFMGKKFRIKLSADELEKMYAS